jgi:hypothetical protein
MAARIPLVALPHPHRPPQVVNPIPLEAPRMLVLNPIPLVALPHPHRPPQVVNRIPLEAPRMQVANPTPHRPLRAVLRMPATTVAGEIRLATIQSRIHLVNALRT